MFVTIDVVHLYSSTQSNALIRGRLAPNQAVPVRGLPIEAEGWVWHRVNMPGKLWIPEMRVDGSEQLLVWVGAGIKPTPQKLTQPQAPTIIVAKSPDSVVTPVITDEETRVRTIAFGITSRFEGGGYGSYQNYDEGIVSYGRFQFTVKGGLAQVLQQYIANNGSEKALADYLPRVKAADETLRNDEQFKIVLQRAADDPVMQAAQDEAAVQLYWQPLHERYITPRGLQLPLTRALLFDIAINFGMGDRFVQLCEEQFGVAYQSKIGENGIREEDLIRCLADRRKASHDKQAERDNLPGLKVRGDFWVDLITKNNWQLEGEILVKNTVIQGAAPIVTTESVQVQSTPTKEATETDQPAISEDVRDVPESEPSEPVPAVKIRPIGAKKVRVRTAPELAVSAIGAVEAREIVEISADDQGKIGQNGAWVQIRTAQGIEGYSAAWLFEVVEDHSAEDTTLEPNLPVDETPAIIPNIESVADVTPSEDMPPTDTIPESEPNLSTTDSTSSAETTDTTAEPNLPIDETLPTITDPAPFNEATTLEDVPPTDTTPEPTPPTEDESATSGDETPITYVKIRPIGAKKVRIRSAPELAATATGAVEANEVVEIAAQDQGKVGQNGAWIQIRTAQGLEGYSAAWLFEVVDDTAAAQPDSEPASTDQNTVPVNVPPTPPVDEPLTTNTQAEVILPVEPAASPDQTIPTETPLKIRPIGDKKVRIRATADMNAALVGVAEAKDVIEVLEPPAEARAKIGVNGQWIEVRTPDGAEGFTAAWLYAIVEG